MVNAASFYYRARRDFEFFSENSVISVAMKRETILLGVLRRNSVA